MQSFKFLRYALHGDLVEDRRRREERENNAYFNGHFAVCTATLGPILTSVMKPLATEETMDTDNDSDSESSITEENESLEQTPIKKL